MQDITNADLSEPCSSAQAAARQIVEGGCSNSMQENQVNFMFKKIIINRTRNFRTNRGVPKFAAWHLRPAQMQL